MLFVSVHSALAEDAICTDACDTNPAIYADSSETVLYVEPTPTPTVVETPLPTPTPNTTTPNATIPNITTSNLSAVQNKTPALFESYVIEKIVPKSNNLGPGVLNVLIRNNGTVVLNNITIQISGDGMSVMSVVQIEKLLPGEKDYIFATINSSKPGDLDVVIKLYMNGSLKEKLVSEMAIIDTTPKTNSNSQTNNSPPIQISLNITELSLNLTKLKTEYSSLEEFYKKRQEMNYKIDDLDSRLQEVHDYVTDAQLNYLQGDYKKAQAVMEVAKENIEVISTQLLNATQNKTSIIDLFQKKIVFVGSMAAAIASMFTVFGLVRAHLINKKNIIKLNKKINEQLVKSKSK
jgi:archaellum component FlaF (FlaF/FlaG flagellin family)